MCKALSVIHRNSDTDEDLKDCFFGPDAYWIVIRRRDRIAQAVSLAMARNSGLYHFYGDPTNSPDNQTVVNLEDITSALRAISLSDIYLSAFFDKISPQNSIEIYYEDFMNSEVSHMNEILRMCDLPIIDENLYINSSKLQKTSESDKINLKSTYADWLLKNYI